MNDKLKRNNYGKVLRRSLLEIDLKVILGLSLQSLTFLGELNSAACASAIVLLLHIVELAGRMP